MPGSLKEKILGGALWAGAGRILSAGCNFILTLTLARALVPADYGSYFVALSTIMIVGSVGTLGMDQIVVRFVAMRSLRGDIAGLRQVVRRCLGIVIVGTLLTCIAFLFSAHDFFNATLKMPDLAGYLGLLAAWLFFATLQRQLAETFRGLGDIRMATLFGSVRNAGVVNAMVACCAMLFLWVSGKLTLFTALLFMLAASVFTLGVAALILWRHLYRMHSHDQGCPSSNLSIKIALHEGWLLWLAMLIINLNVSGSAWLAGALDSPEHVALFGVALKFAILLLTPLLIVNAVLPPIVAQLHAARELKRLERIIRAISGLLLLPCLAFLAVLVIAGHQLLRILFGPYYEASYPLLILLCAGQIANFAAGAWQIVLPMTGGRYQMLAGSTIAVSVQLLVGIALGLRLGVLGVAIGFCASTVIANIVGMLLVHRKLGIWTFASFEWRTMRDAFNMVAAKFGHKAAYKKP